MRTLSTLAALALAAGSAAAQPLQVLIADRDTDRLWRLTDVDGDGVFGASEVFAFYDASNAAGSPGTPNTTALGVRPTDRYVLLGDQINRYAVACRDNTLDGDALDGGESLLVATVSSPAGQSFAFPTGVAFDSFGRGYVVNAGNSFGPDAIYRVVDLDGDGAALALGEVTMYVADGAFGPGNGPYAPQEVWLDPADVGYLRNSSSGLHGVSRFVDLNANGRADDPGEFTLFWGAGNAEGITPSAGFALEPDRARPGALYTLQIASGGIDQLIRMRDGNADSDAMDEGESAIVYSNAETGFSAIDALSLPDGDVLVTDNSGKRVYRLHDANGDGDFRDAGEATVVFAAAGTGVGDIRQIVAYKPCPGDWNDDGVTDFNDLLDYLNAFNAGHPLADINLDLSVDFNDFLDFLNLFNAPC
ncbi:MAG: hypothetical protein FJ255_05570 [Phycisphaerae bacterium]|nr:hypothetical protein [Phycisphaerae bacterium]